MLIVEPRLGEIRKRRISCGRVYRDLGKMIEACGEDPEHAMGQLSSLAD
jgi:hypothetical protein